MEMKNDCLLLLIILQIKRGLKLQSASTPGLPSFSFRFISSGF
jgi:hypothetical protein